MMIFAHRAGAGRRLADRLHDYAGRDDVVVLGLARGGVPVAHEVATALDAPLDVFVVRKLGMPGQEELAIGAIAPGEVVVVNERWARRMPPAAIQFVIARERLELSGAERKYRGDRPPLELKGKTVIVVDDGLATGASMRAAVRSIRRLDPKEIVVAVPVGAKESVEGLRKEADKVVCLAVPDEFTAVSLWYTDFPQVNDEEVHELLSSGDRRHVFA
jgi:putative phosphoribosyl transferase